MPKTKSPASLAPTKPIDLYNHFGVCRGGGGGVPPPPLWGRALTRIGPRAGKYQKGGVGRGGGGVWDPKVCVLMMVMHSHSKASLRLGIVWDPGKPQPTHPSPPTPEKLCSAEIMNFTKGADFWYTPFLGLWTRGGCGRGTTQQWPGGRELELGWEQSTPYTAKTACTGTVRAATAYTYSHLLPRACWPLLCCSYGSCRD